MSIISKIIKKIKITIEIKRHEMLYQGRLKYLFYRGDELHIVFSVFIGTKPKYNYFTSFASIEASKLFVLDDFGSIWGVITGMKMGWICQNSLLVD